MMSWVSQASAIFGSIAHGKDVMIFYIHILHNNVYHGLLYDGDLTCRIVRKDSLDNLTALKERTSCQKFSRKFTIKKKIKFETMYNVNKLRWVHTKGIATQNISSFHNLKEEVHVHIWEEKYIALHVQLCQNLIKYLTRMLPQRSQIMYFWEQATQSAVHHFHH